MKKIVVACAAVAALALPAVSSAGNAWGKEAQQCIVSSPNLGQALQNGREVHADLLESAGIQLTPKTWVMLGGHCPS